MSEIIASGGGRGGVSDLFSGDARKFGDPFLMQSSLSMPQTLEGAMDLCLFLYFMNPQYRQAVNRRTAHFITRIEFHGEDGDQRERDDLEEYLVDSLDLFGAMHVMGEECGCYGNSFWRLHFPFNRTLIDRRSGRAKYYALSMFGEQAKYVFNEMMYEVPDPLKMRWDGSSAAKIKLPFIDQVSSDLSRVALRKIDPRRIDLRTSWISGRCRMVWRPEEWYVKAIKDGHLWQVNETPIAMLRAIKDDQDFLFNEDEIFHFKAPTISGLSNNGWGLPDTIANYRALHKVQVYRKIDEAVGLDYVLPFRIFTPGEGTKNANGIYNDLGYWQAFMEKVIVHRRKDPLAIHAMPFASQYLEAGATGKELAPMENIEYANKELMESLGIPAELWQGTLNIQTVPTTLRLFENTFHYIPRGFNSFLRWVVRRILDQQNREQMGVSMKLPSMADDLEERNVYLQLAAGSEVSRSTAYRPFGIDDPVEEAKRRMEEDIEIQKVQQKLQQDFQRTQTLGSEDQILNAQAQQQQGQSGGGGGGAAGAAPSGTPTTPGDIEDKATQTAQDWLAIQSNGERSKAMQQVKATNLNLYDAAKRKMEEMRAQGASQGKQQVGQQAAQQVQGGGVGQ